MKMVKEEALKKRTNVSQDVNLLAGSRAVMFNAWHQLVGLVVNVAWCLGSSAW
jgi:hypothetical protein